MALCKNCEESVEWATFVEVAEVFAMTVGFVNQHCNSFILEHVILEVM